jgi:hypothetical protein
VTQPVLAGLDIVDDPDAWRTTGFGTAADGCCRVGATLVRLGHDRGSHRRGIVGWSLAGLSTPPGGEIDGLATRVSPDGDAAEPTADVPAVHENGVVQIDHVVVVTPDLDRTTEALERVGIVARRTREVPVRPGEPGRVQRFFRLGEVILELVGPAEPAGDRPAAFWGLAYTVADLDATVRRLGDAVGRARDAVQPGRRIASLRRGVLAVPTAFMSRDPGRGPDGGPAGGR